MQNFNISHQSIDVRQSVEAIFALITDPASVDIGFTGALAVQSIANSKGADRANPVAAAVPRVVREQEVDRETYNVSWKLMM